MGTQLSFFIKDAAPVVFEAVHTPVSMEHLKPLEGDYLNERLTSKSVSFNKHFKVKFGTDSDFPKSALSSMLGGIGYWYGRYLVKTPDQPSNQPPTQCAHAELFSAVPSRPQFKMEPKNSETQPLQLAKPHGI